MYFYLMLKIEFVLLYTRLIKLGFTKKIIKGKLEVVLIILV